MVTRDGASGSPGANPASSETEIHPDTFHHDNDEESILLQMADEDDDTPPSPGLKVAMEKSQQSTNPMEQPTPTPLFMERPQSSGIDVTAFCFAKPIAKDFSVKRIKPFAKQSPTQGMVENKAGTTNLPNKQQEAETGSSSKFHPRHVSASEDRNHDVPKTHLPATKTLDNQVKLVNENSKPRLSPSHRQVQEEGSGPSQATIRSNDPMTTHTSEHNNGTQRATRHVGRRSREPASNANAPIMENAPFSTSLLSPSHDEYRISKLRRVHPRRAAHQKQSNVLPTECEGSQLTDDRLFQLLVTRIRQREEDAVTTANSHKQLEDVASRLIEENDALKEELQVYSAQLQKKMSESKSYRSQINNWKVKLGKFKGFLDSLGIEYQTLRGESIHLKETRDSLDREGRELRSNVENIKAVTSQVESVVGQSKSHRLEYEGIIRTLNNDLGHSEEKTRLTHSQLVEERKKVATLEAYIQSHSRTQQSQISCMRTGQLEIEKKLDLAFEAMPKLWNSSQTTIRSILGPTMDKFLIAVNALSEKKTLDILEAERLSSVLQMFISQMDITMTQINKEYRGCSESNANTLACLTEQVQSFEATFGVDCGISKKLTASQNACETLHKKIESIEPSLSALGTTIQGVEAREVGLIEQIEDISKVMSEVKGSETYFCLENDKYATATAELGSNLEKVSQELRIVQEALQAKDDENENRKLSLFTTTNLLQETEAQAAQHASENAILQEKIQATESRIREQLNRASVISRDQSKAKFEQHLHEILKEKTAVEHDLHTTKELLAKAQQSQDDTPAEKLKKESESLLLVKEEEIESLQNSANENASRYTAQEAELKRLQDLRDIGITQQDQLQQQIHDSNQRIVTLESKITSHDADREQLQELQKELHTLQAQLSQKEEECSLIKVSLDASETTRLALESGKAKTKGEIHALLLRVQDSERWMKSIREKMEEFSISTSEEPFSETWNKLEILLQSAVFSRESSKDTPKHPLQQVGYAPEGTAIASTPHKTTASPPQGFVQTTEFIYRTKNISRSTYSTPAGHERFRSELPSSTIDYVPDSQASANIIPFSRFQRQLSPAHCSPSKDDPDELAKLLAQTQTPPNEDLVKIPHSPVKENKSAKSPSSTTEKGPSLLSHTKDTDEGPQLKTTGICLSATDSAAQIDANESQNVNQSADKQKAVNFEDQGVNRVEFDGRETELPYSESQKQFSGGPLNERRPVRSNQRTYSKIRQTPLINDHERISAHHDKSRPAEEMHESPYNNRNKKARVSTASGYSRQRRHEGGPEQIERRLSPASLASGSSRQHTANESSANKRWAARGQKRPGRRTRGERYSTRFSQKGSEPH